MNKSVQKAASAVHKGAEKLGPAARLVPAALQLAAAWLRAVAHDLEKKQEKQ